jgi:hypothetical protein
MAVFTFIKIILPISITNFKGKKVVFNGKWAILTREKASKTEKIRNLVEFCPFGSKLPAPRNLNRAAKLIGAITP